MNGGRLMSGLVTVGKEYYKSYNMRLYYSTDNVFNMNQDSKERYKIIFVQAGSGILMLNGERHVIISQEVFCLNETDSYQIESSMDLRTEAIWFHPAIINQSFNFEAIRKREGELPITEEQDIFWLNPFCRRPDRFTGQLNIGPGSGKRFKDIIYSIKDELEVQRDEHWPCRSRTYLIELLFLIYNTMKISDTVERITLHKDPGDMKEVILYLYSNYMKRITLQGLTELFHVNHTTLTREFNKITGMPVMEYLIGLRMYISSQMLRDTLLPISEVTERVGFNDATHFGRMFKKHYGYSPKEYRERNCWMVKGV